MTNNPRVVFDTNGLISAALRELGKPRKTLNWVSRSGVLLFSEETFQELERTLYKPRLLRLLEEYQRRAFLDWMRMRGNFIEVMETVRACSDPDDDKFLELALSGLADYIVTGNIKDFPPSPFEGIPIIRPAVFVETFAL